jgi:hypothetical protein
MRIMTKVESRFQTSVAVGPARANCKNLSRFDHARELQTNWDRMTEGKAVGRIKPIDQASTAAFLPVVVQRGIVELIGSTSH